LFSQNFIEASQNKICIKDVDSEAFVLIVSWCKSKTLDFASLETKLVLSLLKTSQILLFEEIKFKCEQYLSENLDLETCIPALKMSNELSLKNLKTRSLSKSAELFENLPHTEVISLDEDILTELLSDSSLYCSNDTQLIEIAQKWSEHWSVSPNNLINHLILVQIKNLERCIYDDIDISSESIELMKTNLSGLRTASMEARGDIEFEELYSLFASYTRALNLYPCIIASRTESNQDNVTNRHVERTTFCFTFLPNFRELREEFELNTLYSSHEGFQVFPAGCCVSSLGSSFIISGGEYSLGRNSWNYDVLKLNYSTGMCETICKLSAPRRHHSAVIMDGFLYLIGGFNKLRIILSSMVKICLATGRESFCAALPNSGFKIAVTHVGGELIAVRGGLVHLYTPQLDSWRTIAIKPSSIPQTVEFHSAIRRRQTIYLTATYSTHLYSIELPETLVEDQEIILCKVGEFNSEVQNPCGLGGFIYNFYCNEFDDQRTVERFDLSSGLSEGLASFKDSTLEFTALTNNSAFAARRFNLN